MILLQTGTTPISPVMQSLLTGYAINYNHRYRRTGKLYQNRFKSILCDKEEYLLQLVRYTHLNPLIVGIANNLSELDRSPWTSHAIVMGKKQADWYDTEAILSNFGRTKKKARAAYRQFVQEGIAREQTEDLSGGGLIRSLGGIWETIKASRKGHKQAGDERILGSGAFVEAVLQKTQERESRTSKLHRQGWGYDTVKAHVCNLLQIQPKDLNIRGQKNAASQGRALLSKWMAEDLGEPKAAIAEQLGVSRPAMTRLVRRGKEVEKELGVFLGMED